MTQLLSTLVKETALTDLRKVFASKQMYVLLTTGICWQITSTDQIYISTGVGAKFLGVNWPPSGQELTPKLATGFRKDHFRVPKL